MLEIRILCEDPIVLVHALVGGRHLHQLLQTLVSLHALEVPTPHELVLEGGGVHAREERTQGVQLIQHALSDTRDAL